MPGRPREPSGLVALIRHLRCRRPTSWPRSLDVSSDGTPSGPGTVARRAPVPDRLLRPPRSPSSSLGRPRPRPTRRCGRRPTIESPLSGVANFTPCVLRPVWRTSSTRERTILPFSMTTMTSSVSSPSGPRRGRRPCRTAWPPRCRGRRGPGAVLRDRGALGQAVLEDDEHVGALALLRRPTSRAGRRRRGTSCP